MPFIKTHEKFSCIYNFAIFVQISWNFHQNIAKRNWEWYTPFWEVFAQFWIGKGLIFGPKSGLGKSLIRLNVVFDCLQGLTITDLEDLLEDIKVYLELEQGKNTDYWRDIVTVTTDELNKLRKLESTSKGWLLSPSTCRKGCYPSIIPSQRQCYHPPLNLAVYTFNVTLSSETNYLQS